MDPLVIGIIGMVALLALVLFGVHIAVALGFVGFFGMVAILGFTPAYNLIATTMFTKVATFDFAVIPLFILMGMLATSLGLTKEIYECLSLWLSGIRGGLGIASVCACTAFGTLNGSALVTSSVFAKAAVPEMRRYGYDKKTAYGLVTAAGCIGQMIPPSIMMIVYGAISGDSIGALLVAGISPGLALTLAFSIMIVIISIIFPNKVPVAKKDCTMKERLVSLKYMIPIAIVAAIVCGGIFSGIFSSSEAGAIGCIAFFIYGLIKRVKKEAYIEGLIDSMKTAAMLFVLMACGGVFARFMTVSGVAGGLVDLFTGMNMSQPMFMICVTIIFLILGCFLDSTSMIAICVPIFYPTIVAMGIPPMQFAMVCILAIHCGCLTPPVGLCVFAVKGVAEDDMTLGDIFSGAFPFLVVMFVITILYCFVPALSTAIPNMMM